MNDPINLTDPLGLYDGPYISGSGDTARGEWSETNSSDYGIKGFPNDPYEHTFDKPYNFSSDYDFRAPLYSETEEYLNFLNRQINRRAACAILTFLPWFLLEGHSEVVK